MESAWIDADAALELGAVILRCPSRRRDEAWRDLGGSAIPLYTIPPIAALFLAFPIVGLAMWYEVPPPILRHPAWGPVLIVWWLACCAGLYQYQFSAPRCN
jgi:hypothetical protein